MEALQHRKHDLIMVGSTKGEAILFYSHQFFHQLTLKLIQIFLITYLAKKKMNTLLRNKFSENIQQDKHKYSPSVVMVIKTIERVSFFDLNLRS